MTCGFDSHRLYHLTPKNVTDPNITINQDNLILLCTECHNEEHQRFGGSRTYEWDKEGNLVGKKEKNTPPT
ncbi:MAG: HNH endonuclease [Bacilli bacterium]|nr:HNH endonuclease [Bacilli bacterium]